MTKHTDYRILSSSTGAQTLMAFVNLSIDNGYVLIGGVSVSDGTFYQAVAKPVIPTHANTGPK